MTDKQTIIDGVDVSKCEFYNKDDKTCREVNGKYDTDICEFDKCENSNCYYKQLQRKEQECEELKKNVEHWKMEHKEAKAKGEWTYDLLKKRLGQQLDQLKAEKEEIKKYLGISSKTIMERLEELQEFRDNDKDKLYQAEQTLAEIKEFVENKMIPNDDTHIILQLISEVKNAR